MNKPLALGSFAFRLVSVVRTDCDDGNFTILEYLVLRLGRSIGVARYYWLDDSDKMQLLSCTKFDKSEDWATAAEHLCSLVPTDSK